MIANTLVITIALLLALAFWLMGELKFLIPYRAFLMHEYGPVILGYVGVLSVNLFALLFSVNRRFFLKDTGRKLSHLDKQLREGELPAPSLRAIDEETD
jgi:hypothetical protein